MTAKKKPTTTKKRAPKVKSAAPAVSAPKKVLVLRTCTPEMTGTQDKSRHFVWPTSGPVACPDWNPEPVCGGGLHGLAWGDGDWGLLRDESDSKWLVVEVDEADMVKIDKLKVKFSRGVVIYCGTKGEAITRVLCGREAMERAQVEAKGNGIASGDYSKAASSGDYSKAASSGDYSKAASSGNGSKAASSGNGGIGASIGTGGLAAAGDNGLVIVTWWDADAKRPRACVGEVGIGGIEADTWYAVEGGKLVSRGKCGT